MSMKQPVERPQQILSNYPVATRPKMNVFFMFKIGSFAPIKTGRLLDIF